MKKFLLFILFFVAFIYFFSNTSFAATCYRTCPGFDENSPGCSSHPGCSWFSGCDGINNCWDVPTCLQAYTCSGGGGCTPSRTCSYYGSCACGTGYSDGCTNSLNCYSGCVSCNNSVANGCDGGSANDQSESSGYWNWHCANSCNEVTGCNKAKVPTCNNGTVNGCTYGSACSTSESSGYWNWHCCNSYNGMETAGCNKAKVPTCGSSINSCTNGSACTLSEDAEHYHWHCCNSYNGMETAGCMYNKPTCTPTTCAAQGYSCGSASDGCGGTLNCGSCSSGYTCTNHQCVCSPTTCGAQGYECGTASDGCGGTINCGGCSAGYTCTNHQCEQNPCTPWTCASAGYDCGWGSDGCGGSINCGGCAVGYTCSSNNCVCSPQSCGAQGYDCGSASDGCGGTLNCGSCSAGYTCTNHQCVITTYAVSGYVFIDTDLDGARDAGESGRNNATVSYRQAAGATSYVNTNSSGYYSFNVAAGTWYVDLTVPSYYDPTVPNPPSKTLNISAASSNNNFGIILEPSPTPFYQISGYIFIDSNNNNIKDAGEVCYQGTIPSMNCCNQIRTNITSYSDCRVLNWCTCTEEDTEVIMSSPGNYHVSGWNRTLHNGATSSGGGATSHIVATVSPKPWPPN